MVRQQILDCLVRTCFAKWFFQEYDSSIHLFAHTTITRFIAPAKQKVKTIFIKVRAIFLTEINLERQLSKDF